MSTSKYDKNEVFAMTKNQHKSSISHSFFLEQTQPLLINSIKRMSGSGRHTRFNTPNLYLFASIIIYCNLMSIMLSIIISQGISRESRAESLTQERTFRLMESNQSGWTFFVIQTSTINCGEAEDRLRRKALLLHTHTK